MRVVLDPVLTMSVIVQVQQLIVPLCDDSKSVFEEGDDDEETSDRWKISVQSETVSFVAFAAKLALG